MKTLSSRLMLMMSLFVLQNVHAQEEQVDILPEEVSGSDDQSGSRLDAPEEDVYRDVPQPDKQKPKKAKGSQRPEVSQDVQKVDSKVSSPASSQSEPKEELKEASHQAASQAVHTEPKNLSDGSRIDLTDKGFSIAVPTGWEVIRDNPNVSLLAQVVMTPEFKYQRNIQVIVYPNPQYIDSFTAREVEEKIIRTFSSIAGVVDFKIRNHSVAQFADGRKGHLVYTEFKLNNLNMMQALLIGTSPSRHYFVVFTDVAENFEAQGSENPPALNEAWQAMTSLQLDGATPERFDMILIGGAIVGALLILGIIIGLIRRVRSSRLYREFDGVDDGDEHSHFHSDTSRFGVDKVHTSRLSKMSRLPQDEAPFAGNPPQDPAPVSSLSKYDSMFGELPRSANVSVKESQSPSKKAEMPPVPPVPPVPPKRSS